MHVDIAFEFAKVYNVEKVDVVKGQHFSLLTSFDPSVKWFSDNDPVLSLKVEGANAEASADNIGTSVIVLVDSEFAVLKKLTINVVDSIQAMASTLGVSSGDPVNK
jgi:hypothetical protein